MQATINTVLKNKYISPLSSVTFYPPEMKLLLLITVNSENAKILHFWQSIFSLLKRCCLILTVSPKEKTEIITEGICMLYSKKFLYLLSGMPTNEEKAVVHTYKHVMLSKTQLKNMYMTLKLYYIYILCPMLSYCVSNSFLIYFFTITA